MSKSVPGSGKNPGSKAVCITITDSDTPIKKFPSSVRSTKNAELQKLMDFVRSHLAAGQTVTEAAIQPQCKRYPGDSLRALRRVHQCYPGTSRLILRDGLWCLVPVRA